MIDTYAPARPARSDRLRGLYSSLVMMVTWPIGLALFIMWSVVTALSILTVGLPLVWPLSRAIDCYVSAHRRWARTVLTGGTPAKAQARAQSGATPEGQAGSAAQPGGTADLKGFAAHTKAALTSKATWRGWVWMLVNCVTGLGLSIISVVLLAGTAFYLCYPLLYATTPHDVFGTVFGLYELHSVSQAWIVTPVALICFGLWWLLTPILARANAHVITALVGHERSSMAAKVGAAQ